MLDDTQLADPARAGLARLPSTLVVSGLEDQLRGPLGATAADYLTPLYDRLARVRALSADDEETLQEVSRKLGVVLDRVVRAIEAEVGLDLGQLGLSPDDGAYEADVLVLYHFFVCDRVSNAREVLFQLLEGDRRRIAERYRKTVEKKNQTVAQARRLFQSFDDVVVWLSVNLVLADLAAEPGWSFDLAHVLLLLGHDPAVPDLLTQLADAYGARDFAARYAAPALAPEVFLRTAYALRDRWSQEAPKKPPEPKDAP
jgi:hypothetical protein